LTTRQRPPPKRTRVNAKPQFIQKRGSRDRYIPRFREVARAVFSSPKNTSRPDVEIWFHANSVTRRDIDNITKPVLVALTGFVHNDDYQVRSVRVVAVPSDDALILPDRNEVETMKRLLAGQDFLINVFVRLRLLREGLYGSPMRLHNKAPHPLADASSSRVVH